MNVEVHEQIHRVLEQRTTGELLDIWQANDRQKWSSEAMQSVGEILRERQVVLPPQQPSMGEAPDEDLEHEGVLEVIPAHDIEPPTPELVMGNKTYDPPREGPVDEPHMQQVAAGGYVFQIPLEDGVVEQTSGYYPSEANPLQSAPQPDQASRGWLAGLAHWLFSDWGTGGVYRRRPHHPVHRARAHVSIPHRRAPVHRSVAKGRHK